MIKIRPKTVATTTVAAALVMWILWVGFIVYILFWHVFPLIQALIHYLNKP